MLDLTSLNNAIKSLDNAVLVLQDEEGEKRIPANVREVIEAGVIQNSEFTYDLCWKFMV
ncbi:MAG TPA: nucleotidyltransferase substrate binding protein [Methanospirillum sp.]|uniref:nucleotidyltransferase substrate binding protein n=1 Tax=Methanospirillum sp. TaxID=45200 RepID=UPI002D01A3D5|nr:nucleotidyltransferase substrate binding protein [Methanospirillum sp.]HWQ65117.1 nucleotidyltransferase substrate binding protein [Methanospirillum sp.]